MLILADAWLVETTETTGTNINIDIGGLPWWVWAMIIYGVISFFRD